MYRKPLILFLFVTPGLFAQESWTLQKSIDHALENNLQIKQSLLNVELSKHNLTQSKAAVLPSLNGFATHTYNFGRTIDPFTNQFADQTVQSNSFGLSSNFTIFSGLQNYNTIKQNQLEYLAGKYDADKLKNDIVLSVVGAYMQVLFAEELVINAQSQVSLTRMQLDRTAKLVAAGSLAKGALLNIDAQLATEELQLVNAENQLTIAYLNLTQLLEIPYSDDFRIEKPLINIPVEELNAGTPGQIYQAALSTQPEIKGSETRMLSARKGLEAARGGYSPRLTVNASYGTGYSGLRKQPVGAPVFNGYDTIGITGSFFPEPVLVPNYSFQYETTPFRQQLEDNLNKTFGFNLTIPIFNGFAARTAVSRARIAFQNAQLSMELTKRQLEKNIQQAYADAVAAIKKHQATQRSVEALRESFKYTEQRFDVGMVNAIEYSDAKNKLARAESDLLQAKYDYVFKRKVLDFYQGRPLVF